jgi:acyl-CoA thioester hydrolase
VVFYALYLGMQRIKIELPDRFHFSTELAIQIGDVNYGGHVGNEKFLAIAHEARMRFLQSINTAELQFYGVGLIIADCAIEFKAELFWGDTMHVSVAVNGIDKFGFDLIYKIEVEKEGERKLAGIVKTGMLCFDYAAKKMVRVPENFIALFK